MTILPKKKQNKNTSSSNDVDEHRDGYVNANANGRDGQMSPNGRTWPARNDVVDKRPAPENGHAPLGPSHSKRRHRGARERDVNPDAMPRALIGTVRSMAKSAISSPSGSPRNNPESEMAIPGSSSGRDERCVPGTSLLVQANFGNDDNNSNSEDVSGYNSGDEYHKPNENPLSESDWEEKERLFERIIRKEGFIIKKMCEDGACLFRAVADQVYGDQEMHSAVRKLCMDYMEKNGDYFSQYVTENFADYIQRKRSDHIHGNHIEIQALSEMFNRPIQVYHYSGEPINIENCQKTDNEPIRLSYHRNCHYNSIVDPYKATVGVGLGLPSFKPGVAEKSLVEKALRISEQHELEQAMLEDKIRATDWEATNEAIEEQIARQSYLEWLRENELRSRGKSSATSTLSKMEDEANKTSPSATLSPRCYSPRSSKGCDRSSPKRCNNGGTNEIATTVESSPKIETTSSFLREVPPSILGLNDWDDSDTILARVLAQSQAEYIDSLKARRNPGLSLSEGSTSSSPRPSSSSSFMSGQTSTSMTSSSSSSSNNTANASNHDPEDFRFHLPSTSSKHF